MKTISILLLLSAATICLSQEVAQKSGCDAPAARPTHSAAPASRREVSVQCGANSVNQSFASEPAPPATGAAAPISAARQPPDRSSLGIALIAGASGVLGALAGALASLFVAQLNSRSQLQIETTRLRANLIAQERLRWLQDIRQRLSKLYRTMDMQYNTLKRPVGEGEKAQVQQTLDTMAAEVMEQTNVVNFMLNPEKDDQAALRNSIQAALQFLLDCYNETTAEAQTFDDVRYQSLKRTAFDAMTRIGIRTWRQIKELQ
jgi:hypothetical protein